MAATTGLPGLLAEGALRRCCERANIELVAMTPRDLRRLLPLLEPVLMLYLSADELRGSMEKLQELADGSPPPRRP